MTLGQLVLKLRNLESKYGSDLNVTVMEEHRVHLNVETEERELIMQFESNVTDVACVPGKYVVIIGQELLK